GTQTSPSNPVGSLGRWPSEASAARLRPAWNPLRGGGAACGMTRSGRVTIVLVRPALRLDMGSDTRPRVNPTQSSKVLISEQKAGEPRGPKVPRREPTSDRIAGDFASRRAGASG